MLACTLGVLRSDANDALALRYHAVLGSALALLTLASAGTLLSRTLELDGGTWNTLLSDTRVVLTVTHFGHVWLWRLPALALLWLSWILGRKHPQHARIASWVMLLAVAGIAMTRSETGHPADHGDFTLAVWIDWLHLLAAATWVGSLFGMSLVVFPKLLRDHGRSPVQAATIFQRLSTLSGAALAVLLAGGIFNATQQLGSVDALWTTRYGIVLDIKLAVVLGMIAIGAHNRYVKLPRLLEQANLPTRPSWLSRVLPLRACTGQTRPASDVLHSCARAVLLESVLGLAVIGATATLIHAMPPADLGSIHGMAGTNADPDVTLSGSR